MMIDRARSTARWLTVALLVWGLGGCAARVGVDGEWREQVQIGRSAAMRADYEEARVAYEHALESLGDAASAASQRAGVLRLMAQVEDERHNPAAAETLLLEALDLVQRAYGENHPHAGWIASDLGPFYQSQHRYAEAEYFQRRALQILEPTLDPRDEQLGVLLNNLGSVLVAQDRHDEGVELIERALELAQRNPEHDAEIPIALFNLNVADAYREMGRLTDAEAAYKTALAAQRVDEGYRVNSISMAALDGLGRVEQRRGDLPMAVTLYRAALGVGERLLGIGDFNQPGMPLHEHLRIRLRDVQARYDEARALLSGRWI
jgi:tetratricopeptide (TPR) repeat protein